MLSVGSWALRTLSSRPLLRGRGPGTQHLPALGAEDIKGSPELERTHVQASHRPTELSIEMLLPLLGPSWEPPGGGHSQEARGPLNTWTPCPAPNQGPPLLEIPPHLPERHRVTLETGVPAPMSTLYCWLLPAAPAGICMGGHLAPSLASPLGGVGGSHGPYHLPQCVDETQGVCTHADESGLRLTCKTHVLSSSQTLECQSPRGSRSCAWTPECSLAPCRSWREAARWTFFTSIFHSHSPVSGPQAT